ncbi:MAG: HEAT repeat domain-containing protein [bacterium]|nr:HEAT repeat domain-containing protein [bacterium]
MNNPASPIRESTLSTNLSEQAHSLARELAMACKKMSIYGPGHPQAIKAVEKPFFILGTIFRFKNNINLNVFRGQLYLLNIRLRDTVFNSQILQFLQVPDVNAVIFERRMTVNQFSFFVETLVKRETAYDPKFQLGDFLNQQGVDCIHVNTEQAFNLLEERKQYRGDVDGDFSVRRMALDQLGTDLSTLAEVGEAEADRLLQMGIDFDPDIVRYLLPERVAAIPAKEVRAVLTQLADQLSSDDDNNAVISDASTLYMSLFKLVEFHPEKNAIIENLEDRRRRLRGGADSGGDAGSATGKIKIESSRQIENLIEEMFVSGNHDYDVREFCDRFARLLKTGQAHKAQETVNRLMEFMGAGNPEFRQKALNLLGSTLAELNLVTDRAIFETTTEAIVKTLEGKSETYEYSELIWKLFETCHREQLYELMARLTSAMADRRIVKDNVTVYDSMAVKKGFENISRRETISQLVSELIEADHKTGQCLKEILVSIGSEEIALALSRIISHPLRNVRQLCLKILAELGKASLKVFSHILYDDAMFRRDDDRHELPDSQWYVIRNSIFVLGSLHDDQGVPALRVRISDSDVRVRREIISSLEKIGGEEAIDCLTLMADDPLKEIREASIIAIGLVGPPEAAPLLIDIALRNPRESIRAVRALGKMGGEEARAYLTSLLEAPQKLSDLANGRVSRDELKVAVVKSLGDIGDSEAIEHVKKFRDGQSATSKIFFKNSSLNKAITEVLSRR